MTQDESNQSEDLLQKALMIKGNETSLDLSLLSEEEQQAIVKQYHEGRIDIQLIADELRVDIGALGATLRELSDAVTDINASGNSATISHTQDTKAGRTEIIVGNTDRAAAGKLTRSQTGERDWTPYYAIGGVVIAVLILLAIIAQ